MMIGLANRITRPGGDAAALELDFRQAQLDSRLTFARASSATDVISGVLTSFATDAPRISAANGLRVEESRTNLVANNTLAASSGGTGSSTADLLNGTQALLFTETTANTFHLAGTANVTPTGSVVYTASCFVKAGSCDRVQMLVSSNIAATTCYANYYLSGSGSVTASGAGASAAGIQTLSNGWYRLYFTFTTSASPTAGTGPALCSLQTGSETRLPSFAGTSRTFTYWGSQLEAGAFATSYIPSTTGSATRAADLCSMTPIGWFNAAEGTFCAEGRTGFIDTAAASSPRLLRVRDSAAGNFIELRRNVSSRQLQGCVNTSSVDQAVLDCGVWDDAVIARAALVYRLNDMAGCFAGGTVQADTSGTMPSGIDTLRVGAGSSTSGFWNGYVRTLRYWNHRLTNDQLKAITQ